MGLIGIAHGGVVGGGVSEGSAVSVGRGVKVNVVVGGIDVGVRGIGVPVASGIVACGAQDTRIPMDKMKAKIVLMSYMFPDRVFIRASSSFDNSLMCGDGLLLDARLPSPLISLSSVIEPSR
jgi:hypothetical protein